MRNKYRILLGLVEELVYDFEIEMYIATFVSEAAICRPLYRWTKKAT